MKSQNYSTVIESRSHCYHHAISLKSFHLADASIQLNLHRHDTFRTIVWRSTDDRLTFDEQSSDVRRTIGWRSTNNGKYIGIDDRKSPCFQSIALKAGALIYYSYLLALPFIPLSSILPLSEGGKSHPGDGEICLLTSRAQGCSSGNLPSPWMGGGRGEGR